MTRDEAIEAGARALFIHDVRSLLPEEAHHAEAAWALVGGGETGDDFRTGAAAVLDAIGWAGPVAYVVAHEDHNPPGMLYPAPWRELASARAWAQGSERVWGLVPVEGAIELGANEGGA